MAELDQRSSPEFTHRATFGTALSDIVDQVVDRAHEAWAAGRHMIALLDADVQDASAGRLGSSAAAVDFRPQAWLATRSAPAIIATCRDGGARPERREPLAMLTQPPSSEKDSDATFWHRAERRIENDLAGMPVDLVCIFDTVSSTPSHLHMARVTHPVLIVNGVDCPNPDFRPYDELFPPYHLQAADDLGPADEVSGFGPFASSAVKQWLHGGTVVAHVQKDLIDDLALVVNEAITTIWETDQDQTVEHRDLADHWPHLPLVRVQLWRSPTAIVCDVTTRTPLPSLSPISPPDDHRLRMLWFAEKVSGQITVSVHDAVPGGTGSRIRIRALRS
jgi:hypothetical protein